MTTIAMSEFVTHTVHADTLTKTPFHTYFRSPSMSRPLTHQK
jgi:hypothetical protein